MIRFFIIEHRRHPWVMPGVLLTGSAALGSALPDIMTLVRGVLS